MDLTGKWKYKEDYGYGVAEGELFLKQEGNDLSGRIIFTDKLEGEEGYMLQEFLVGRLEEHKVKLDAEEFDIIHSEHEIEYELDSWFGILVDADTIVGVSKDAHGQRDRVVAVGFFDDAVGKAAGVLVHLVGLGPGDDHDGD